MFTKIHLFFGIRAGLILALAIGMLGISPVKAVLADTLVVTNSDDSGAGSLRQAIANATSGDTITFHASLAGQTITLSSSLMIGKDLTMDGSALVSKISVSGDNSVSVFIINPEVSVVIDSLIIKNGKSSGGAGISNAGTLTVINSLLSENHTVFDPTVLGGGYGGAIYNLGDLTIINSTFSANSGSRGGAIYCNGTMTVINSTFHSNSALADSQTGDGGAIFENCDLTITHTTFSSNHAAHNGGALLTDNDANPVVIINSTFYDNTAVNVGGGIANYGGLIITNSTFSHNRSSLGGAIRNGLGGDLSLRNSILANSVGAVDCIKSDSTPAVENINNLIETTGADLESCGSSLLTSDPNLGALQDNGGFTQTMALGAGSPAINTADAANCPETDQRGVTRPQGSGCDIGAYEAPGVTLFRSSGAADGSVLESDENSNRGGVTNPTAATFILGDAANKQQYRSILHFNTSSLPDHAVITRVVLKIKKHNVTGADPFTTHLKIAVDIRKGAFSNTGALQATDFQAGASKNAVGLFANNPQAGGWYLSVLKATAYPYISHTGVTQFRLRFQTDDDNDSVADFIRFYSGNSTGANRPVLVIEYYVP